MLVEVSVGLVAAVAIAVVAGRRGRHHLRGRLLARIVRCAEEAGLRHWIDADTLCAWMHTGGDPDLPCHHLSVASGTLAQWTTFRWLLVRNGLHLDAVSHRVTSPVAAVQVHHHVPLGGNLVDLTPTTPLSPIPAWVVGVPSIRWWPQQQTHVRVPFQTVLAVSWRKGLIAASARALSEVSLLV